MSFSDYSLTPSANVLIAGQNIAPGGPPAAVGPGIRQIMADGKDLADRADKTATNTLTVQMPTNSYDSALLRFA